MTIKLSAQPAQDVTVTLTGLDTTEGSLSASTFTFTAANWNTEQTLTITGVDDALVDGNIAYTLTATSSSSDEVFKDLIGAINVVNIDNGQNNKLEQNDYTAVYALETSGGDKKWYTEEDVSDLGIEVNENDIIFFALKNYQNNNISEYYNYITGDWFYTNQNNDFPYSCYEFVRVLPGISTIKESEESYYADWGSDGLTVYTKSIYQEGYAYGINGVLFDV